jgi:hypothetical protein
MKIFVKEAAGYGAASACALVVDMTILWVLVHSFRSGIWPRRPLLFWQAPASPMCCPVRFAFKQHRLSDRRAEFA